MLGQNRLQTRFVEACSKKAVKVADVCWLLRSMTKDEIVFGEGGIPHLEVTSGEFQTARLSCGSKWRINSKPVVLTGKHLPPPF